MKTPPQFELVEVGFGSDSRGVSAPASAWNDQLWRKYRLTMPGFECDILEVFPSRKMFLGGQGWLTEETPVEVAKTYSGTEVDGATHFLGFPFSLPAGLVMTFDLLFQILLTFEVLIFCIGRP